MAERLRTVLFVAYGGGHVNMLVPVLTRLKERPDLRCVTLALTTAGAVLNRHGLPHRGFLSLVRPGDEPALDKGRQLASALVENPLVPAGETAAYLGLSYMDMEARLGKSQAARVYAETGRQSFLPLGPLRRLFDEVSPDLVVATISPRAEEAALRVAAERDIPSLCLVDLFARPALRRALAPGYGTRVAVISEGVRRWLIAGGRPASEILVLGNPAFDHLASPTWATVGREVRARRGWGDDRVILWASQREAAKNPYSGISGDPALPEKIEEALRTAVARHSHWRLVVRPHPNEPARGPSPGVELSGPGDPLYPLLAAVDAVVIMTSTVGLEARLMGKPVVSVDVSVFSNDTPFAEEGISQGITDLAHLEIAVESALASAPAPLDGFAPPGRATDAVIGEIDALLGVRGKT